MPAEVVKSAVSRLLAVIASRLGPTAFADTLIESCPKGATLAELAEVLNEVRLAADRRR